MDRILGKLTVGLLQEVLTKKEAISQFVEKPLFLSRNLR